MPTKFERSVIDMGQGSYIITLPKSWVRYFGIKPGEKLTVIANGDLVIHYSKEVQTGKNTTK
jgi:bifunctional DNA-binding transcriptional regulator/antitoxin component of YhaV-PrlF toxin-antitoxin module